MSLTIKTDDSMSMSSETTFSIIKSLNRIKIEHETQFKTEIIQIYREDIDSIIDYLVKAKEYIDSGYKTKKPK